MPLSPQQQDPDEVEGRGEVLRAMQRVPAAGREGEGSVVGCQATTPPSVSNCGCR